MTALIKSTAFGDLLHLVSGGKSSRSITQQQSDPEKYFETDPDTGEIIVDWYGEDDSENPFNWSFLYKSYVTLLLFCMTMPVYMGSSIVSPGIPDLAQYFGVSTVTATLSMSLFVWAYGVGPMILSPITEISWIGRNGVYIVGLGLFTVMQVPNALVNNIAGYMILRFISGFLGSPVLSTGGATVGDIWRLEGGFMNGLSFWCLGATGGPTLGPLVSGYAVQVKGWRWSLRPLLCLNGIIWLMLFFTLPETSGVAILSRRAKALRDATGNERYRSRGEINDRKISVQSLFYETLCRPFQLALTEPVLICANFYVAYLYGIMYCFFEAFPLAFEGRHGFSTGAMGLSYVSGYIGCAVMCVFFCIYNVKIAIPRFRAGNWRPEYRMEPAFLGGILFPVSLFWFGWTSFSAVHWVVPMIAFAFFIISGYLLFQGLIAYIGENYPRYMASVYAGNTLFRASLGGAFPLFATQMFNRLTLQGGCSLLGGLAALLFPITIVFYMYGPKLREKSKNAGMTQDTGKKETKEKEEAV